MMTISDYSICLLFDNNNPLATQLSTSSFYRLLTAPYSSFAKGILSPILDDPQSSVVTGPDQEQSPASYFGLHCKCRSRIQSYLLPHTLPSPIYCNENPIYVLPEKKLRGLSSNFRIHVSVRDLHIPRIRPHISLQQNRQTDGGDI